VNGKDNYGRNFTEGYGFIYLENKPGCYKEKVETYKINKNLDSRIYEFFLGGFVKFKENSSIFKSFCIDEHNIVNVMNKMGYETVNSGYLEVEVNVVV